MTKRIYPEAVEYLRQRFEVDYVATDDGLTSEELRSRLRGQCHRGLRWNRRWRALRGNQMVQQFLLGIDRFLRAFECLLRGFERLPLLVELFLLGYNLFPQFGDVVRRGGVLRQTQDWDQ